MHPFWNAGFAATMEAMEDIKSFANPMQISFAAKRLPTPPTLRVSTLVLFYRFYTFF